MSEVFTIAEVAHALKVSRSAVRFWIRTNQLKPIKVGTGIRILVEDLRRFINKRRVRNTVRS